MESVESPAPRRRGRPPAADSAATRTAILDGARELFGSRGYGAATNKDLAAAAGVTTGALYHYVESKLDLYMTVHADMQLRIYRRFQRAEASQTSFLGKLSAVLDAAQQINVEDPSLAKFVGVVRADVRRYPEVAARLADADNAREGFFLDLVEVGVSTGEVRREDVPAVRQFVRVILVGLIEGTSENPDRQRQAIDSIMGVLRGELVRPVDG
ncbi:MAG: TetR/AcrR family transcriptional regulator [Ilumatobacter sp.]